MRKSVYLLVLLIISCKNYNLNNYQKKAMPDTCHQAWQLLTKYMVRDNDGFLRMKNLPLDDDFHYYPKYEEVVRFPMKQYMDNSSSCFTIFSKREIEKILGKPTLKYDENQYYYYIRLDKQGDCPDTKITKENKYRISRYNTPYGSCHVLYLEFDEKKFIKTIMMH
jgi:hypothetical protein